MSKPKLANILQTPIIYTLWYNYVYNTYTINRQVDQQHLGSHTNFQLAGAVRGNKSS